MSFTHWVRARWLELRLGFSSYLAYAISFFNLVLLVSLRFGGSVGWVFYILLGLGLSAIAVTIGHAHLKVQQDIDVRMEYSWLVEETAKRTVELLKENEK